MSVGWTKTAAFTVISKVGNVTRFVIKAVTAYTLQVTSLVVLTQLVGVEPG